MTEIRYYKKYTGKSSSIVDALKAVGRLQAVKEELLHSGDILTFKDATHLCLYWPQI